MRTAHYSPLLTGRYTSEATILSISLKQKKSNYKTNNSEFDENAPMKTFDLLNDYLI